ncbi:hypothetical protein GCM10007170_30850 [Arthrobacter liuii]|uniref:Uncharacterized protein n=1 Tax=Arthrobacter liuii TaxID=1476996 RepID=A0ABQ2AUV9_9MICC|nr:hypothetical protein GCM10007170_30850 [Arthrobacter liuii]
MQLGQQKAHITADPGGRKARCLNVCAQGGHHNSGTGKKQSLTFSMIRIFIDSNKDLTPQWDHPTGLGRRMQRSRP